MLSSSLYILGHLFFTETLLASYYFLITELQCLCCSLLLYNEMQITLKCKAFYNDSVSFDAFISYYALPWTYSGFSYLYSLTLVINNSWDTFFTPFISDLKSDGYLLFYFLHITTFHDLRSGIISPVSKPFTTSLKHFLHTCSELPTER